jgi:hypothetical protein
MQVFTPVPCCVEDMAAFHSTSYLAGLQSVDGHKVCVRACGVCAFAVML